MNTQVMIDDLVEVGFSTYGIRDEVNGVILGKPISQPTIYNNWKGKIKCPRPRLIKALHIIHQNYRPDLYGHGGPLRAGPMTGKTPCQAQGGENV